MAPATSAAEFIPKKLTLECLQEAATSCRGCGLWEKATQVVMGEGRAGAPLMLIGEQPGDREDLEGRPFVGPAGRLLDRALEEVGIERADTYVTNAVKHFKFVERGKRRIHKRPSQTEVNACVPWLHAEVGVVRPRPLACLGAIAAGAVFGPRFRVSRDRGHVEPTNLGLPGLATVHPSSILRVRDDAERRSAMEGFVADLRRARAALEKGKPS